MHRAKEVDRGMHGFRCSAIKRHRNSLRLHFVRLAEPPRKFAETLPPHTPQFLQAPWPQGGSIVSSDC